MEQEKVKTENETTDKVLMVSGDTPAKRLAMSIFASCTKENLKTIIIRGVGAGAVNQMTKAFIIAKGMLGQKNVSPKIDMFFKDVDNNITAIEYHITF